MKIGLLLGAVAVILTTLKLTEVIGWSWWWVLSPLLILLGVLVYWFTHNNKKGLTAIKQSKEENIETEGKLLYFCDTCGVGAVN